MAATGMWPTPMAADAERGSKTMMRGNPTLLGAALMWPTPRASEAAHSGRRSTNHNGQVGLSEAVQRFPTPTVAMHKGSSKNAMTRQTGASRENDRLDYAIEQGQIANGRLNPTWVEWLMGFPLGWTDLGPSETRSSRRSSK
jgi:DNA (cytosine-5)-methyltransferase 1